MIVVTIGGVTIGIMVLGYVLIKWYPGRKALAKKPVPYVLELAPFLLAWCYGALGVLTVQGLIGWAFDTALWASNWLGDAALWLGTGEDVGQAAQGTYEPLTVFGNCAVLIATACVIAAIKFTRSGHMVKMGMWCGLCLGTSSSVAGLAAVPLADGVNYIGALVYTAAGVT